MIAVNGMTQKAPLSNISLFARLSKIPDPRKKRGVRHNFHGIIKLVVLGFISRLVCLEHIVEFAKGHWDQLKDPLGFVRDAPPDATTIGRVLKKIDRQILEDVFRDWVSSLVEGETMNASVDGKALRNVCDDKGNPLYSVNVFAHDIQIALAQADIPKKKGEATTFRVMLKDLFETYPGLRILTGDVGFTGRNLCKEISRLGRHYLLQIKGNQKKVDEVLQLHFKEESEMREPDAKNIEKKKITRKTTSRELWVCDGMAADYIRKDLNYPEARQVAYIKKLIYKDDKLVRQENWYGVTSCPRSLLPPEDFLETVRKHWEIENGLHHVKDRSWFEDHQYTKDQRLGGVLGALRNLSLNVMRTLLPPNKDRAKRRYNKSLPKQALANLMAPLKTLLKLAQI